MNYILYCMDSETLTAKPPEKPTLAGGYTFKIWHPSLLNPVPPGLNRKTFTGWWLLYLPKLLQGFAYSIFLVYYGEKVAHYTMATVKTFKFPFMGTRDIQIGPSWTDEEHRGKGLASYVVKKILETYAKEQRNFWWLSREENQGSRRLIEKVGFFEYGKAVRKTKYGTGCFVEVEPC